MTLPPVCMPKASGICISATAAADPHEEPPGVRDGSWGLVVGGPELVIVNSVVVVLPVGDVNNHSQGRWIDRPKIKAPAARRMATASESKPDRYPSHIGEPYCVGMSGACQHLECKGLYLTTFRVHHIFDTYCQSMQRSSLVFWYLTKFSSSA